MLNTFEKNISCSLNLISENNFDIFQNALLFNTNKLITDNDYCLESSFPSLNDKNDFNNDLAEINKDNLNGNHLNSSLGGFGVQTKSKTNINYSINKAIPIPLFENEIINIINNKMNISNKIRNILDSDSSIKNDPRIEIVKKDITEKLNTPK